MRQGQAGLLMYRIYNARDARCKERGITDKAEAYTIAVRMVKALRHSDARTHTKTGINHIERHCVSESITAYIAAEIRLSAFHSLLYRIE